MILLKIFHSVTPSTRLQSGKVGKTSRDADCLRLERLYPGYGFAKHKGYPTAAHLAALARLGPCPEHRMSFGPVKSAADLWYNTGKQQMA